MSGWSRGAKTDEESGRVTERQTILLVDDDADFVAINRLVLERAGYRVSVAFGGKEGLDAARAEHPDLVVLDVMMQEAMEGFEVARQLQNGSCAQQASRHSAHQR